MRYTCIYATATARATGITNSTGPIERRPTYGQGRSTVSLKEFYFVPHNGVTWQKKGKVVFYLYPAKLLGRRLPTRVCT